MSRNNVIWTGLLGVILGILLTVVCIIVMRQNWIPILVTPPIYVWSIFSFLAFFSVLEMPLMILAIREIAKNDSSSTPTIALATNALYTFFAAVYAAPFILLTGQLIVGGALASLSLVRFLSSVFFLPQGR